MAATACHGHVTIWCLLDAWVQPGLADLLDIWQRGPAQLLSLCAPHSLPPVPVAGTRGWYLVNALTWHEKVDQAALPSSGAYQGSQSLIANSGHGKADAGHMLWCLVR